VGSLIVQVAVQNCHAAIQRLAPRCRRRWQILAAQLAYGSPLLLLRQLRDFALPFWGLLGDQSRSVDGEFARVHLRDDFVDSVLYDFARLLVGPRIPEPGLLRRDVARFNARTNFRKIFRKLDVRALTLPVTDFSLQSLADRHTTA
jgi:hypothetical protein